jgi:hypothetical protein
VTSRIRKHLMDADQYLGPPVDRAGDLLRISDDADAELLIAIFSEPGDSGRIACSLANDLIDKRKNAH